jgi:hypothetical protein
MTTPTLAQVRDGLEARLNTISGLRVYDYIPEDVAGYPAAVIFPPTNADYSNDLNLGSYTVEFVVMLLVPATIDRNQLDLYALMDRDGAGSVFATIEADRKLGGLDVDARVIRATDPLSQAQMASTQVYQRAVTIQAIIS